MKIDFGKIKCEDVDGKVIVVNMSRTLGNTMYRTALTDEEMKLGREIYDKGEIEVNKPRAEMIKKFVANGGFYAFVRAGIIPTLDKIIKENKGLEKVDKK